MTTSPSSNPRRTRTLLLTALGLTLVLLLGLWDARHEDARALQQSMQEHHLYAATLATHIDLDSANAAPGPTPPQPHPREVDQKRPPEGFVVLLVEPVRGQYLEEEHRWVNVPEIASAYARGEQGVLLSPQSAQILNLPRRMAVAGLSRVAPRANNVRALAVVTSAEAERDRSRREQWRAVIGIMLASGLVLLAGIGTLRMQKRAFELEQQRALNKLERDRHGESARANRMATIAALSSGIAHEISTPLGVISGRIEQLQAALKGQERYERAIDTIAAQVHRINTVIRGFLSFARGEAPLLVQRRANDIARSVAQYVDYRFANAEVKLDLRLDGEEALQIACEPALFEQAIVDVLVNALEASKPGQHVCLEVDHDERSVRFLVLDEGSGIPESAVARVTDPFFTTKAGSGGSGLGLTIAKEILVHHRGTLSFEVRKNGNASATMGTKVTVQLPRLEEAPVEI